MLAGAARPGEPDQALAVAKVVGGTFVILGAGVVVYVLGRRKAVASG